MQCDHHSTHDHDNKQEHHQQTHSQSQFFTNHRKNEVSMGIRQIQHLLPSVTQTEAFHSAAPPGNERLHLLQSGVVFEFFRIHKRGQSAHALRHSSSQK